MWIVGPSSLGRVATYPTPCKLIVTGLSIPTSSPTIRPVLHAISKDVPRSPALTQVRRFTPWFFLIHPLQCCVHETCCNSFCNDSQDLDTSRAVFSFLYFHLPGNVSRFLGFGSTLRCYLNRFWIYSKHYLVALGINPKPKVLLCIPAEICVVGSLLNWRS